MSTKRMMVTAIKLNVGGEIFETTKSTLTRFDGYFRAMFMPEASKCKEMRPIETAKDDSGDIFIDRDPAHFRRILNYMRDGDIELPKNSEDVKDLQKEAQFYRLKGLVKLCEAGDALGTAPTNRFFARNDEELAEMISNSTKKLICVFYYNPSQCNILNRATGAMLKYGKKMDFCFRQQKTNHYFLYNNETKQILQVQPMRTSKTLNKLDVAIETLIRKIDEY